MKTATFYRYVLTNPQHTIFSSKLDQYGRFLTDSLHLAKLYEHPLEVSGDLNDYFDGQDVTEMIKVKVTIELDNLEEE